MHKKLMKLTLTGQKLIPGTFNVDGHGNLETAIFTAIEKKWRLIC